MAYHAQIIINDFFLCFYIYFVEIFFYNQRFDLLLVSISLFLFFSVFSLYYNSCSLFQFIYFLKFLVS